LDDGRDYVSVKEFFSVHVTFSVLNSWITYFAIFNLFVYLRDYIFIKTAEFVHVNNFLSNVAMTVMMFEATVYLAYYKDIMFAFITLLNYIGMYLYNTDVISPHEGSEKHKSVTNLQIAFISLISVFIIVTLLHDFDKVFYRQYSKFYSKYQKNRALKLL
jgi:hypothetical protein